MSMFQWRALAAVAVVIGQAASQAQETSPDAAEFQRIEATRARETAVYDAQEAACARRFAVSGCVKEVQSQRRAMLANLRRQEATLHERQLAEQGAAQRRLSAQKLQERQQQDAQLQADSTGQGAADKLQVQKDKQAEHAAKPAMAGASAAASASLPAATGLSAAEQTANRGSYARKQAEAEKKRQDIAKRLADKGPGAAPLPLPR
jgi:colicin import membrane protein